MEAPEVPGHLRRSWQHAHLPLRDMVPEDVFVCFCSFARSISLPEGCRKTSLMWPPQSVKLAELIISSR